MAHGSIIFLFVGRVSPPGDYCQLMPSKPSKHRLVPPVLPNQLLQIILNQDVARHVSILSSLILSFVVLLGEFIERVGSTLHD